MGHRYEYAAGTDTTRSDAKRHTNSHTPTVADTFTNADAYAECHANAVLYPYTFCNGNTNSDLDLDGN